MRSPLTASLEPLFVRPELRLGRLLVAARAADGQRREDGALEELAAGRLAFDGVLEPCAGQSAVCCDQEEGAEVGGRVGDQQQCLLFIAVPVWFVPIRRLILADDITNTGSHSILNHLKLTKLALKRPTHPRDPSEAPGCYTFTTTTTTHLP